MATSKPSPGSVQPRIIIHGGAGNLTRETLNPEGYAADRSTLLSILSDSDHRLRLPSATALDVATYAVSRLEDDNKFNSGHGAVFTTAGTHELEASVMVSRPGSTQRKRGVGVMGVRSARNPTLLAREMYLRGDQEDGGGAFRHVQLHGQTCEDLLREWELQTERPSYFYTRRSWDQHRRGLGLSHSDEEYEQAKSDADEAAGYHGMGSAVDKGTESEVLWEPRSGPLDRTKEVIPQGTVGCVVLDSTGTLCAATSTGGITNKLPGRIGDTPTLGAGFWAEEWTVSADVPVATTSQVNPIADCFPWSLSAFVPSWNESPQTRKHQSIRGAALSGTGNGDSFLQINAARTAAAMVRFSQAGSTGPSLQDAVTAVAGPKGFLQESAGDRWGNGEGEGGLIAIELNSGKGKICFDYNCGGMVHAWIDDAGEYRFAVFQDEK